MSSSEKKSAVFQTDRWLGIFYFLKIVDGPDTKGNGSNHSTKAK